mgnify:CR=1 FL=1|jgi:hypothetical protein
MAKQSKRTLNAFGIYLEKRSVNKSEVCRRTGIHPTRMTWLCYEPILYVRSSELQLIALAINVDPLQMHNDLFGQLKLKEEISPSEKIIANITSTLGEKNLIEKHELTIREIERIAEILPFCEEGRTDDEIISHIDLKRKSPKFQAALKAAVEASWVTLQQRHEEGKIINTYTTTEQGKKVVTIEEKTAGQ